MAEVDPDADAALRAQLDANVAAAEALEAPFDQLILGDDDAPGRVALLELITSLQDQGDAVADAGRRPRLLDQPGDLATRCGGRPSCSWRPPPSSSCSRAPTTTTPEPSAAPPTDQELADQGGDATVDVAGTGAFAQPVPGLDGEQRRDFAVGNNFFNDNWVTAPSSTEGRDGLGPLFNAQSCSSCHFRDGRAQPPGGRRRSRAGPADPAERARRRRQPRAPPRARRPAPGPRHPRTCRWRARCVITTSRGPGEYDDGTPVHARSSRTTRCSDADGEPIERPAPVAADRARGVRRRPARGRARGRHPSPSPILTTTTATASRAAPTSCPTRRAPGEPGARALRLEGGRARRVEEQNAGAFAGDIGITSSLRPDQPCTRLQPECLSAPDGGDPELDDRKLDQVTFYTRTLAVPARRDVGAADTRRRAGDLRGARLRVVPRRRAAHRRPSDIAALDDQVIRPYTDLLLHDMGAGLADGRRLDGTGAVRHPDPTQRAGVAHPTAVGHRPGRDRERHTRFLHDGRARNLEEAILWHGGEAEPARDRFRALDADERAAAHRLPGEPVMPRPPSVAARSLVRRRCCVGCVRRRRTSRQPDPAADASSDGAGRRRRRGDRARPTRPWSPPSTTLDDRRSTRCAPRRRPTPLEAARDAWREVGRRLAAHPRRRRRARPWIGASRPRSPSAARPDAIDDLVAGTDPVDAAALDAAGAGVKGIVGRSRSACSATGPRTSPTPDGARRCEYLASVTALARAAAAEVLDDWTGGYRDEFVAGMDGDPQASLDAS